VASPKLVAAVDGLGPASYRGIAYRHVAPRWNPLSGAGAQSYGGRWNPPDSFATIYLATTAQTAIAEFERMAARSRRDPADFLPRRLYRCRVNLAAVLDLRGDDARAAVSLSDGDLRADDLAPCRAVGEAAHYLGREAIIAPSATGRGTVLAVFFDRLGPDSSLRVLDYETWSARPRA
jgi:RES domain-containing protein